MMFDIIKRILRGCFNPGLERLRSHYPRCSFRNGCVVRDSDFGDYVTLLRDSKVIGSRFGDYSYLGRGSVIVNTVIGKYCSLGPDIRIGLNPHPTRGFVSTSPLFYSTENDGCMRKFRADNAFNDTVAKTRVGHDVWIGANTIIPGGITISNGAVIAAGSVVVSDVEPYAIVGGNPARLIRYRFPDEQIARLLESCWWDWPEDKLMTRLDSFLSVERFLGDK